VIDYDTLNIPHPLEILVLDCQLHELGLPSHATPGSAGGDLRAMRIGIDDKAMPFDAPVPLHPGQRRLFGTGLIARIRDPRLVGVVASRSGLSLKHGVRVAQGIGVIDSDYTGELGVILTNDSNEVYRIRRGERIAQLLIQPVIQFRPFIVEEIDETERAGGYGSTGVA